MLSLLLGFITSFLPDVLNFFKDREGRKQDLELARFEAEVADRNRAHEIAMMSKQSELNLAELSQTAEYELAGRRLDDLSSARKHDSSITGNWFTNILRASVRPVITYAFFTLFAAVKVSALVLIYKQTGDIATSLQVAWTPATQELFGGIIGFWFGDRTRRAVSS